MRAGVMTVLGTMLSLVLCTAQHYAYPYVDPYGYVDPHLFQPQQTYYTQPHPYPGQYMGQQQVAYMPPQQVAYMPPTYLDVPVAYMPPTYLDVPAPLQPSLQLGTIGTPASTSTLEPPPQLGTIVEPPPQQVYTLAPLQPTPRIIDQPFDEACKRYADKGWWGRFISLDAHAIGKLSSFRDVGDVVFAMDGASLAKMCDLKHMDDVLLGIGYPASTVLDMKMCTPGGQPMTLVVWDSDEHGLDQATWRNMLKSADQQLDKRLLEAGKSRGSSIPKMYAPRLEKALKARTSPTRTFKFGEPQWGKRADGTTQRVVPVNGEAMNLDIAIESGFAVDDDERFIAQLRSFLYNELACNPEFKGDGFTWNYDDGSDAWGAKKGAEYLAANFDVLEEGKHHHEIVVRLPWKKDFKASCEEVVRRGWWGRFVAEPADNIHSLDRHKDAGDVVIAMDGNAMEKMCGATYMDEILEVMDVSDVVKADMKTRERKQLPMTLAVWDDDEHYLSEATWRNVLQSADEQIDIRLAKEGRSRIGIPRFCTPKYEKDLAERTSPKRLFQFGEAQYRNHRADLGPVVPVNGELMNLNIAMIHGFAMRDPVKLSAQIRSFLYNEVGCYEDFTGDGFARNYDEKADSWGPQKHAVFLAPVFEFKQAEMHGHKISHREIAVELPWRGPEIPV